MKNAPDILSKVNSVCQQYMVAPSLKNWLELHRKQILHRASRQRNWKVGFEGKDKLGWKHKDTECKSGKDMLPTVAKIKEQVCKWNSSRWNNQIIPY